MGFFSTSSSFAGTSGHLTWARYTAAARAAPPMPISVYSVFGVQTMLWLPVFGTFNVSADFGGCACTRRLHGRRENKRACTELVKVLLYVHRNRRLIRDGSPGRPPRLSHSSWALSTELLGVQPYLFSLCQWRAEKLVGSWRIWYLGFAIHARICSWRSWHTLLLSQNGTSHSLYHSQSCFRDSQRLILFFVKVTV